MSSTTTTDLDGNKQHVIECDCDGCEERHKGEGNANALPDKWSLFIEVISGKVRQHQLCEEHTTVAKQRLQLS